MSPLPEYVEVSTEPCAECDGKGKLRCPGCNGEGHRVVSEGGMRRFLQTHDDFVNDVVRVSGHAWHDIRERLAGFDKQAATQRKDAVARERATAERAAGDRLIFWMIEACGVCGLLATLGVIGVAS